MSLGVTKVLQPLKGCFSHIWRKIHFRILLFLLQTSHSVLHHPVAKDASPTSTIAAFDFVPRRTVSLSLFLTKRQKCFSFHPFFLEGEKTTRAAQGAKHAGGACRRDTLLSCYQLQSSYRVTVWLIPTGTDFRQHKSQDGRMHGDHQFSILEGHGRRFELRSGGVEISGRRFE